MAKYRVTAPDGSVYEITAPDDATEEQIRAFVATKAPSAPTQRSVVDTMSPWERRAAGAGAAVAGLGRGLKQAGVEAYEALTPLDTQLAKHFGNELPSERLRREEVSRREMDQPLLDTREGMQGFVGGNLALAAPASLIPGVNTEVGATVLGGILGGATPLTPGESRAEGAGAGVLLGRIGQRAGSALQERLSRGVRGRGAAGASSTGGGASADASVQAAPTAAVRSGPSFGYVGDDASAGLTQAQRQALEAGQRLGMRTTPGQATGSRALQQFEAKAESQPWSSGPFNAVKENNARVVNREFLRAIGERGDEITPEVIGRADARIGRVFEDAARNNRIGYDDFLQSELANIEATASVELGSGELGVIRRQLANILEKASGQPDNALTGQQYQNIRMSLNRVINGNKPELVYWARQIRSALDDALLRSVPEESGRALQQAREQYRILATALGRVGVVNVSKGSITPGTLANAFAQADRQGFVMGGTRSGLYDALRFYQAFPSIVGDSGTATRMPMSLTEAVVSAPVNIGARAYASAPSVNAFVGGQNAMNQLGGAVAPAGNALLQYAPGYFGAASPLLIPQLQE